MTLRTHCDDLIWCIDFLQISKTTRYQGKHLDALDCTAFSLSQGRDWTVLRCKTHLFLLNQPWVTTHCCLSWKILIGESELCDILSVYMYLKVGTTHFYLLDFYNLVFGLTYFIKIEAVQMMNIIYSDMTLYGQATIIGG